MAYTTYERDFVEGARLGRIATATPDGLPDVAPVGFRLDGDDVVIGGLDISRTIKHRNIEQNATAVFVVDDLASTEPWHPRGVKVRGRAVIQERPGGRSVIRITPDTIWSWGLNPTGEARFANIQRRSFDDPLPA